MAAFLEEADDVLRSEGRHIVGGTSVTWVRIALVVLISGAAYGAVVGCYGLRGTQAIYSAAKMPLLLTLAGVVCLPFFFVSNLVLGLGADFPAAYRGVITSHATTGICLLALSPIIGFYYVSGADYPTALMLNGIMFLVGAAGGQINLARHYRPLIARNSNHRIALFLWLSLYLIVSIKVGSILRPFIGDPSAPTEFFRASAFTENPFRSLFWSGYYVATK